MDRQDTICNHHQKHIGESIFWTALLYNDDIWCRIPKKEISLQICGLTLCPSVCHRAAHVVICKIPILGNSSALTDWVGRGKYHDQYVPLSSSLFVGKEMLLMPARIGTNAKCTKSPSIYQPTLRTSYS